MVHHRRSWRQPSTHRKGTTRCFSVIEEGDQCASTGESAWPLPVPRKAALRDRSRSGRSRTARENHPTTPRAASADARDHSKGSGDPVRAELVPRRPQCLRSARSPDRLGRSKGRRPADQPHGTTLPASLGLDQGRAHTQSGRRASRPAEPWTRVRAPGSAPISTSNDGIKRGETCNLNLVCERKGSKSRTITTKRARLRATLVGAAG